MNAALEISGAGLATQQAALDIIANNVANLNTASFKRSDVQFAEMIARRDDLSVARADLSPTPSLSAVTARGVLALNEQGEIERTGRSLDLAIEGEGFIELMGPGGQTLLWRGGALAIGADGLLTGANGLPLRAAITIPDDVTALTIGANGAVTAAGGASDTTELGRITLVRTHDTGALERLDGGLYAVRDEAALIEIAPGEHGGPTLVQGAVEHSNVRINDEMIRLLIVQRAYAANAQILQAADQLAGIANALRR